MPISRFSAPLSWTALCSDAVSPCRSHLLLSGVVDRRPTLPLSLSSSCHAESSSLSSWSPEERSGLREEEDNVRQRFLFIEHLAALLAHGQPSRDSLIYIHTYIHTYKHKYIHSYEQTNMAMTYPIPCVRLQTRTRQGSAEPPPPSASRRRARRARSWPRPSSSTALPR